VVVYHEPLVVPMYNGHSKSLSFCVAKRKSKLRGFDFRLWYKPGMTTPADYRLHPPLERTYSNIEREDLGFERGCYTGRQQTPNTSNTTRTRQKLQPDGDSKIQSTDWKNYSKEMGFKIRPCTPKHPEADDIAEQFMAVIVMLILCFSWDKK